jgi:ABC-type multidrug transport system ATPase subunit
MIRATVAFIDEPGKTQDVGGEVVRLGRESSCEIVIDSLAYPDVADEHARIEIRAERPVLVNATSGCQTILNGALIEQAAPIWPGDKVRLGQEGPTIEVLSIERIEASTVGGYARTFRADVRHRALLRGSEFSERFEIRSGGVIGRDPSLAQYHLDHPHVSRQHARLTVDGRRVVIEDLDSSNGTFVNGRRINRPTTLISRDRIDIGPFSIQLDGGALVSRSRSNNIELAATGLRQVVTDRKTGKPLTLLDEISLVVRPKEFVCVLGPSGSGKSTLLTILSGRVKATAGSVMLNGEDLHTDFEALKGDIAVVPQKDVLYDSLAVGSALRYTARLRLPSDLTRGDLEAGVSDILEVVGLCEKRDTLIRSLSGGQVKRASLANELVARPSLLFLDEVTSGLDEQTDREVMDLFRQVADGGKTVVCITHSLANVETSCHLVVILSEHGRLAFIGTPDEAKAYFGITRLGDVYKKLAKEKPEVWHDRFRASEFHQRYVTDRLTSETDSTGAQRAVPARSPSTVPSAVRQLGVLIQRYVSIWRGDRYALGALFAQSVLVALLLGSLFGNLGQAPPKKDWIVLPPGVPASTRDRLNDVLGQRDHVQRKLNLLNLMVISCFWFGCNTAAKELVKDRTIFRRERDYSLRLLSYFFSKFVVLTIIGVLQATLLFGIVVPWCHPPGPSAALWSVLAGLATAGTAVGLLISAFSRSEEVATAMVPIAIIPQIILAGLIAPLRGFLEYLAKALVTVYWGQQSVESFLAQNDLKLLNMPPRTWTFALAIVGVHALLSAIATIVMLWFTGRRRQAT